MKWIEKQKKDAYRWGNHECARKMVDYMDGLGYRTPTMGELLALVDSNDHDDAFETKLANDLWWATIGQFETKDQGFELSMERDWMDRHNLVYLPLTGSTGRVVKGCFASLFTICRNSKKTQINRHGKKIEMHLKITRDKDEITDDTRGKKRPKGTTLGSFAHLGKKRLLDPEEAPKKMKEEAPKKMKEEAPSTPVRKPKPINNVSPATSTSTESTISVPMSPLGLLGKNQMQRLMNDLVDPNKKEIGGAKEKEKKKVCRSFVVCWFVICHLPHTVLCSLQPAGPAEEEGRGKSKGDCQGRGGATPAGLYF